MPPGKPPTPNPMSSAGGGKPKPTEKVGDKAFQQESSLTNTPNTQGTDEGQIKPQEAEREPGSGGKKAGDRAKDFAASASDTVKDVKSVAEASGKQGIDVREEAQDVKRAYEEKGTKGAAGEVGRKAVGKTAQVGLEATGVGATVAAPVGKGIEKALKKENLKKIALIIGLIIILPAIIIGFIAGVILYAAQNPAKFLEQVLTDPKSREFVMQATELVPQTITSQGDVLKRYGYVENKPGAAIAQNSTAIPKPGSLAEKVTNIDIKEAQYKTSSKPSCPYTYTTKEMVGPNGQKKSVIDKVYNNEGKEIEGNNQVVYYCILQSMPIYNLMVRVDKSREVNAFSGTILNYGDDPKFLANANPELSSDVVYDKTLNRITSTKDDAPKVDNENVNDYIKRVREALQNGDDPYSVDSDFQFKPGFDTEDKKTVSTMCTFAQGYLTPDNLRKAINGRLNTGQRSGIKWNTISSTRELSLMSNEEMQATFKEVENWTASRAYSQNVYGTQTGEAINPESLSNTAYGAGYQYAISVMTDTVETCSGINYGNLITNIANFLTGNTSENTEKLNRIKANYNLLKTVIIAQSNGKFTNPDDFGLQQLMIGVIRMSGGSAVSGLEPGPQNFNNQSQGFRGLSNQYMMRLGGRFLTKAESEKLERLTENTRRDVEEKNGIAYRLFAEDNIRSLANVLKYETPKSQNETKRIGREYIAKITNPFKLIADVHSSVGYIATGKINQAFAASATGDAYMRLDTVGLPSEMLKNVDVYKVSDDIQEIKANGTPEQKKLLEYFDKCSKSNIPSRGLFAKRSPIGDNGEPKLNSIEIDGLGYPYYPAMADKFEYPKGGDQNISNHDGQPLKEEKREWMACEIYLLPRNTNDTSGSLINESKFQELFGVTNVYELSDKYHIYLYSNSIADLMVELSNTEESNNIYANSNGGNNNNSSVPTGPVDPGQDTSNFPTPAGTTEVPGSPFQDYGPRGVETVKIKVVQIDGYNLKVNASIGAQVKQLLDAAKADGINLDGGGFRSYNEQVALRRAHCGTSDYAIHEAPASSCNPPTAKPGNSMHEVGLAIDFTNNGRTLSSGSPGFNWLRENASKYGLSNLPSEPWHWSTNGN